MNRPNWKFTDATCALKLTDNELYIFMAYLLGAMDVDGQIDEAAFDRAVAYVQKERGRK